ncbi:ABC transporter related protein OS=Tsukamurella paurometabola (strain ATCC 8368 / DSM / CCUG 35730 / CIP 100753 / JCM 10117 / KCTC 9821 / NBRC 16120 / NCIMB 702349 / NCTC 13040) OX=521096 GN=Tpau_1967 PE=4 SV=1 [Tsukamurella paurometabola]|uniref:ABC transporter related protein n=1 Tax=Tsukamurella paurometabola (strain ATCC 8368 / DSM 20162 / CCUG 35730 / CIP 100753 / JCM 10117 / KCTC 9821 / NBRC 16120 / NCIMB 702349 / NCTC 13040) TaxID=521096 RepID=D5UNL1_TSUPD|nr:ATP-binding cassette domain-containing protein [Tsukamurella paurometabola]ADG78579.1 ABC transporter related protein [Tsukamurella paurometabola DSM 20162]SUP32273.1 L-cystine import ATP-binding protein TcyN [Tsukamurella paurometabola]
MTAIIGTGIVVRRRGRPVLDGVNVTVHAGAVTGVLGPSGAGKTTLLRVLAGLLSPDAGSVDHGGGAPRPAAGTLAMLAQHPRTVCNPRWPLARIVGEPRRISGVGIGVDEAADRAGLQPSLLDRFPAQVSDGQLQRACVARILVQAPRFLLADEPVAMLDPVSARAVLRILDAVTAAGTGVVLVSHNAALVRRRAATVIELQSSGATSTETSIEDPRESV